jgi:crotonobetainyl-CoA:carnitine CoA-transferase CaiB-like acyl-CoA transferase
MLSPYRVVDLTDGDAQFAGAILAMLGADVVVVEPPDGARTRSLAPFRAGGPMNPPRGERGGEHGGEGPYGARTGQESLRWWSWNRGKRSVVLDAARSPVDREQLCHLLAGADVLLESASSADLAVPGLDRAGLEAVNPGLVHVSITPFGQDGPKAAWPASDLTVWAAAGPLLLTGDHDRPPLGLPYPQAFLHAAAEGACGALLALHERARSGLGQHVDVSAQQCAAQATQSYILAHPLNASGLTRFGGGVRSGPIEVRIVWPALDGHVSITFIFGAVVGPMTHRLMAWVCEEGYCDEATRDKDWVNYASLLLSGDEPLEEYDRVKAAVAAFTASKTKAELLAGAQQRRVLIVPVTTMPDLLASEQLASREYWDEVDGIRVPGPAVKASATPLRRHARPPRLGEHTGEVLGELRRTSSPRPAATAQPVERRLPLDGLKVLDLMWVMAGPAMSRVLADFGATVVRVESATRVETARTIGPFRDDKVDVEHSGLFGNMNAGKLGLTLNLARPGARDVLADLVEWADVVADSFAGGRAMAAWGLDEASLRRINPDVVVVSSCLFGQTGPLAGFAGYGNLAAAVAGFTHVTGWPDRPPTGPAGAYTDYTSPRLGLAALLAALDHRRRTGEGQFLDIAQAEAALHFLTPALLDCSANGFAPAGVGNRSADHAPHGVYPVGPAGDDRWVAIACETDEQWRALAGPDLLDRPDLAGLGRSERLARYAELDEVVAAWTGGRDGAEVERDCVAHGVPAHRVQDSRDCYEDPQLRHRRHFLTVPHAYQGSTVIEGPRLRLSATPACPSRGAPTLGEHSWEVLHDILGYDDDRIADLAAAEVLE